MPVDIMLQLTANHAALAAKREELTAVRAELAARTAEVGRMRFDLKTFEDRYFQQAGMLYAELDALEAQIAEREVDLYGSDAAKKRAEEARQRANDSRDAAAGEQLEAEDFDPPATLKTLFRDVAKRIHPDRARDVAESEYFTLLMARANQAYRRGDAETLQQMLEDHREIDMRDSGDDLAAEIAHVARQIQHARRDLTEVLVERHTLLHSEIALLHADAELVAHAGRDLVADLALKLREQISDARRRLELVDRQITAHGR